MGHIFVMDAITWLKNVINLKILLLFVLKKVYTGFFFLFMSKPEAKKLMIFYKFSFNYIKMDNTTYYQRNREIMLNRAKDCYEDDKERLKEQARN